MPSENPGGSSSVTVAAHVVGGLGEELHLRLWRQSAVAAVGQGQGSEWRMPGSRRALRRDFVVGVGFVVLPQVPGHPTGQSGGFSGGDGESAFMIACTRQGRSDRV